MKTSVKKQQRRKQRSPKKTRIVTKRKKCSCFQTVLNRIKKTLSKRKLKTLNDTIQIALKTAHSIKNKNGKLKKPSRVVKIPKTGGVLPLIPIFAGLSALGALSGGAAGIVKAINSTKAAQKELEESQRHNKTMEAIAMGKGLFLKPYKKGLGIFL